MDHRQQACSLQPTGYGHLRLLWSMAYGPWPMTEDIWPRVHDRGYERGYMAKGLLPMAYAPWPMLHHLWPMLHGLWSCPFVHHLWPMLHGLSSIIYGLCSMAFRPSSMAYAPWPFVHHLCPFHGPWSIIHRP
jgi:hypothetical protein